LPKTEVPNFRWANGSGHAIGGHYPFPIFSFWSYVLAREFN
jgi:hypothetical protein